MATTAEFIGVYIADIITTATITIIVATIITITAIGETYRVVAVSKTSCPQAQGSPGGQKLGDLMAFLQGTGPQTESVLSAD
jgi:hypothetical protein